MIVSDHILMWSSAQWVKASLIQAHKWLRGLKAHIGDRWVCGTETNGSMPIPDFISLRYIADCGLSGKRTILKFEWYILGPALDSKPCSLACWTCSFRIQQNGAGNESGGGVIIEILVSVPQTR